MVRSKKEKKILQVAKECFARFGYEKTTLEDIGRMSGLNKASTPTARRPSRKKPNSKSAGGLLCNFCVPHYKPQTVCYFFSNR
jgi:ribosome-binding protein aMBF1 (putative translation factor)